ncbi:MAG: T9SS type A sorting domain-containing protein [bacterium]|nr:T9SS type A sorting domain-containing protein [bacterium]
MMKSFIILFWLSGLCLSSVIHAAPGDTLWTRTYGGALEDIGYPMQQTSDGGYIIAGYTKSFGAGDLDFYAVKTDSVGDTLWTRTYGGSLNDHARSVQQTDDGGYILAGYTTSFGAGSGDCYLIKTDAIGSIEWDKTYGGIGDDCAFSAQQTSDGGYILAGYTTSFGAGGWDFYAVKTDSVGDTLWTRTYGGSSDDWAWSVQQTIPDGGYIITGQVLSYGAGGWDFYAVKTDSVGDTLWTRTYGGTGDDHPKSVLQTIDGGYTFAGLTNSFGAGSCDFYLVNTNSLGDTLWTRTYGGILEDIAFCVQQTSDGGYVLAGYAYSFGAGGRDFYLVKTNTLGDTLWTRTYGGSLDDTAVSVQQTTDGAFVLGGHTLSFGAGGTDFYLMKVAGDPCLFCEAVTSTPEVPNENGTIQWNLTVTNCGSETISNVFGEIYPTVGDCASGTQYDYNLTRIVTNNLGVGQSFTGRYWYRPILVNGVDLAAIAIDVGPAVNDYIASSCFEFYFSYEWGRPNAEPYFGPGEWGEMNDGIVLPGVTTLNQNYPNPFNASTTISFDIVQSGNVNLSVYNLAGQKIESLVDGRMNAGRHNITWDASTYSSGIYFYKLTTGDRTFTKRMTLLK